MHFRLLSLFLAMVLIAGCAELTTRLNKPVYFDSVELAKVKKIAIVSFYAPKKVSEAKGRGQVRSWRHVDRRIISKGALRQLEQAFRSQMGWRVLPSLKIVRSRGYRKYFSSQYASRKNSGAHSLKPALVNAKDYFHPRRMNPIAVDKNKKMLLNALGNMAKDLDVDAVVLARLNLGYGGEELSPLGTGKAMVNAGIWFQMVNRNGRLFVDMPPPEPGDMARSREATTIIKGSLVFKRRNRRGLRNMFTQTAGRAGDMAITRLKNDMK